MGVQGAKPPAGARGVPLWRQLKGCRVLPAGVSGVALAFLFFARRRRRRAKREKEVFRGHPEPRQRAGRPLQSRINIVKLTPKGDTQIAAEGWRPSALPFLRLTTRLVVR